MARLKLEKKRTGTEHWDDRTFEPVLESRPSVPLGIYFLLTCIVIELAFVLYAISRLPGYAGFE